MGEDVDKGGCDVGGEDEEKVMVGVLVEVNRRHLSFISHQIMNSCINY